MGLTLGQREHHGIGAPPRTARGFAAGPARLSRCLRHAPEPGVVLRPDAASMISVTTGAAVCARSAATRNAWTRARSWRGARHAAAAHAAATVVLPVAPLPVTQTKSAEATFRR
jgi:hypothetical protein